MSNVRVNFNLFIIVVFVTDLGSLSNLRILLVLSSVGDVVVVVVCCDDDDVAVVVGVLGVDGFFASLI